MSRPQVVKEKDWWKEGFTEHDLVADGDLYFETSMAEKEIRAIMGFLKDVLGFSLLTALDICCGAARHVSALRRHVPYVVGLDYSFDFLKAGMERGFSDRLVRGDAYKLPFQSDSFDLVTCMGNSLGYGKRGDDRVLISEAARVCKKGDYIAINIADPEYCRKTLRPNATYEYETSKGKIVDLYQRTIEHNNRLKCRQTTIENGKKVRILNYSIRLFDHRDLVRLGRNAGMDCVGRISSRDIYGDAAEGTMGAMANSIFYIFRKTFQCPLRDEKLWKSKVGTYG